MPSLNRIYVEIDIDAPIDRVWELTQSPELHERWDLRFTEIRYLPKVEPQQPQRFLYATRIGFGLTICGEGESIRNHDSGSGERTSSLKFWSDDPRSLIGTGAGYWRYTTLSPDKTRFVTGYDYEVRFGAFGRFVDRLVFRPLMRWATAWSFDRLRLWIERAINPSLSLKAGVIYTLTRAALASVWFYEGLVPKLIFRHRDEVAMLMSGGMSRESAATISMIAGVAEAGLAIFMLWSWHARWPLWLTIFLMPLAAAGVLVTSPAFLAAPFNPATLNILMMALAAIGLIVGGDSLPSALRCSYRPSRES